LEEFRKTAKGWKPYAEVDPNTGEILKGSLDSVKERPVIKW
jgi:hypothetical protein